MTEGAAAGAQTGTDSARDEVIQRFRKAVNTTSFPSASFSVPTSEYEPKQYLRHFYRKDSLHTNSRSLAELDHSKSCAHL